MIGTEAAVVRATVMGRCMRLVRILRRLVVIPELFVKVDIGCDQNFLKAVFGAGFLLKLMAVFKHDFSSDLLVAYRA